MAVSAVFPRRRWPEKVEGFDLSSSEGDVAHVLAVDDSLVDRKVIEKLLKISSCKVTAVDSGRRALEFLGIDEEDQNITAMEELKIDLIITDYCMPGMTGYDLLKKIKESSAFRDVPVVIMSSENVLTRIHRCLEEGAEDFIVKPVKLSDVKRLKDQLMPVSKIKTATDGPDLSTSSESPPSISSPESSPSPASTPSSPSSPSAPLEPLDSASRSAKPLLAVDQIIPDSASLEPLDSPSRSAKPLSAVDQIIPDSPL